MSIFRQQSQPGKAPIDLSWLTELSFIPVVSDWLELLASRLAQPLMFVSSLYIIAETVTPGLSSWSPFLDFSTKAVMSLAPEIVLPGCFQQAQQAKRDEKENKAGLLYGLCFLFGVLTLLTFASFLWHFAGGIALFILFVRCASGVSYTIILKIDKEQQRLDVAQPAQPVAQSLPTADDLAQLITQSVENAVAPLRTELRSVQRLVQNTQNCYEISEIAQSPEPIQIDAAQPTQRPAIAQKSTMLTDMPEAEQGDQVSTDEEEDCADDDTPIAQRDTQPVEVVNAQRNMRKAIFEFLESQPDPLSITDTDLMAAIPGCTKSQSRRYRGQYKALQGGVQ